MALRANPARKVGDPAAVAERERLRDLRHDGGRQGLRHGRAAAEAQPLEQVRARAQVHHRVGPRLVLVHRVRLHHAGVARAGELRQLRLQLRELAVEVVGQLRPVHGLDGEGLAGGAGRAAVDHPEAAATDLRAYLVVPLQLRTHTSVMSL